MADITKATASLEISNQEQKPKYALYKVCVTCNGKNWFIFRRYSEFTNLFDKIKNQFPGLPKLPGKRLFGGNDPKFLEKRREGLDGFVRALLANDRVTKHPLVREFFCLDQKLEEAEADEKDKPDEENQQGDDNEDDDDNVNLGPSENTKARPSDFNYLKIIGKGSFGKVYQAMHKIENNLYAVKVLNKSQIKRRNEVRHIMSERNVLVINLKHPFLVGLNYSFQTKDKLYFVMDYLNGGELFFHLQREKRFPEARARFYGACLASSLGYLHEKNIIYRDLKPENLLLDEGGYLVITDFGLCKEGIQGKETTNTFCGTPEYLAPEVILKQPYDRTVDWWCLGSVLYEMMFGLPPFYSRDHKEMYDRIVHQPLRVSHAVSPGARDILYGMLQKDRHRRLGSKKDFVEIKEHAFFLPINWEDLDNRKIPPPFVPKLKTETATPYVDKEFTDMPVGESVARSAGLSASIGAEHDAAFGGFTFVRPMVLEDIAE